MSIRDWSPGRVSLIDRAEAVPNLRAGGQDRRTAERYTADLAADTDRSLRESSRWRAGQPLDQEERWAWKTTAQAGSRSGIPAHGGRWPNPPAEDQVRS